MFRDALIWLYLYHHHHHHDHHHCHHYHPHMAHIKIDYYQTPLGEACLAAGVLDLMNSTSLN